MDGHLSSGPVAVLLLAALTSSALGQSQPMYFSVGDPLVLTPPKHGSVITSVVWTHNTSLVVEWVNNELEFFRSFKNRTELDQSTAQLTVNNAKQSDSGEYRVEINNEQQPQVYRAAVIKKVPKPSVVVRTPTCSPTSTNCNFTCQGDTSGTEPLTYSWRKDSGEWEQGLRILNPTLEEVKTKDVKQISCRMENPVSEEESILLDNPMYEEGTGSFSRVGLAVGLTSGIALLILGGLVYWKREAIKKSFIADSETKSPQVSYRHKYD